MGRPRKYGDEPMDQDLRIPVTRAQKDLIVRAAGLDSAEMAGWARPILIQAAKERVAREKVQKPKRNKGLE